jgi:lipopolysaccharide/colanic/teichoic acid biosynthesis glycosyltransferase
MLHNLIGAQGKQEVTVGNPEMPFIENSYERRVLKTGGREKRGIAFYAGYFLTEYVWSHFVLLATWTMGTFLPSDWKLTVGAFFKSLLKRLFDLAGSFIGIVLCLPFFIILPILIKLDSPGPVFYRQLRVGHNRRRGERRSPNGSNLGRSSRDRRRQDLKGRPFCVIKFRTMIADAEKKCGPVWATHNDPRITRLGHILRKTRLDEIPQFLNVFTGQMSLVGPRPERPKFVEELSAQVENYDQRLMVKPGLTGLAQIENGYDSSVTSVVKKVHYDLQYIQHWSVWQDVKIMLKTVLVVVTGRGAF